MSIPRTFGPATGSVPLSYLDDDFTSLQGAVTTLQGSMTTAQGQITALQGSVGALDYYTPSATTFFLSEYASLAAALTAIGSTVATLVVDTGKTLTANATFPSTLSVVRLAGGSITKSSTYTLTINGPFSSPDTQAFFGFAAGNVTFGKKMNIKPEWWGAVGDGSTDDTVAIQSAISAAAAGSVINFAGNTYKITAALTGAASVTLWGTGYDSQIHQVTSNTGGLALTASNINIYDIYFNGPQYATYQANEIGINAYAASYAAAISNIRVEHCFFRNWGCGAVQMKWVTGLSVNDNQINDVHYYGIETISCVGGDTSENIIDNVPGSVATSWDAYGIALTRMPLDSLVTDPRSANINVCRNKISNIPTWQAIDSHAGENISIKENIIRACKNGIAVVGSKGTGGTPMYAPLKVAVVGNIMDSGVTAGNYGIGIQVVGAYSVTVQEYAYGCSIIGNTITGYGDQSNSLSGGIQYYGTIGLVVSDNPINLCSPYGILADFENYGNVIDGNTITDIWSNTTAAPAGICILDDHNVNFLIGNNSVYAFHSSIGTYRLNTTSGLAVSVSNATGNTGKLNLISTNATTLLGGSGSGSAVTKNLN